MHPIYRIVVPVAIICYVALESSVYVLPSHLNLDPAMQESWGHMGIA